MGGALPEQVTSQESVLLHSTEQLPLHATWHWFTELHVTSLFGPTSTEHCMVSWQLRWQLSPQITPQLLVCEHSKPQPEPQD